MTENNFAPFESGQEKFFAEKLHPIHYQLIIDFLELLSDKISCAGCNAWNYPENWEEEDKHTFSKIMQFSNGTPEDYSDSDTDMSDFSAVATLQYMLKSEKESSEYISEMLGFFKESGALEDE